MRLLRKFHKWIALGFAVLFLIQAGTGLILANADALLPLFNPEANIAVPPSRASLDRIVAEIERAEPDARLDRLIYSPDAGSVIVARVIQPDGSMTIALVRPGDGAVLSTGSIWRYPTQAAERIHTTLLLGTPGQVVLLIEGIMLAFLAVSGLVLWWPGVKRVGRSLTIRWSGPFQRMLRDLHVTPGTVMALLLLVTGASGALVLSAPLIKPLVARVAPVLPEIDPRLPAVPPDAVNAVTAQQAMDNIRERFPDGRLRQIRILAGGRLIGAIMVAENAANPRAHHIVGVDRVLGRMMIFSDGNNLPAGEAALAWPLAIHTGYIYGPVRPLMLSLAACGLILMAVTGVLMWASGSARRRRNRRRLQGLDGSAALRRA